MTEKPRIVIVGGGFAGLNLVKRIDKEKYDVTLVDRNNFHSFPPLFYQIASCGLDPGSISFPFRREMRKDSVKGSHYRFGEVRTIDVARKEIHTQFETIKYDKLIIAAGTTNNFFNSPDLVKYVYTIKTTAEAMRCRYEILDRLERAALTKDRTLRRNLLSFVVVGGGPSGVEVAGALGEMKRYILPREYPDISPDDLSIVLLEGTDRVLGAMSAVSSRKALEYLGKLMVEVKLGRLMKSYEDDVITLDDGSRLTAGMLIWTAGITGVSFDIVGAEIALAPGRRFEVDEFNRVKGLDDIYAVGDIAYMKSDDYPRGYPQLAQVAIQQARLLASHLNKNRFEKPFVYDDKGSMATVGRNLAVADLKKGHLSGWIAWMAWMFIHLISILGMRNKLTVLINWIWSYCTYTTSLRILLHTTRYPLRRRWGEK